MIFRRLMLRQFSIKFRFTPVLSHEDDQNTSSAFRGGVRAWAENDFKDFLKVLMEIFTMHTARIKYKISKKFRLLVDQWYSKN